MKKVLAAAALALTLVAARSYATTTFAQFEQINNTDTISFSSGALANTTGATVAFNYLDTMPAPLDGQIDAIMTFTASGTPFSGTLSFLRTSDNANLLTVAFDGAVLSGTGTAGSFLAAEPGGTVTFTSDFLDFSATTAADFAMSFSGLSSPFDSSAWTADATGTFAANNVVGPDSVIPEPATWALMILGFGAAGAMLRRRRADFCAA